MNFENFKEKFVEDIRDRLYEQGVEANVTTQEIKKLNESYESITITPEGSNIGVNTNLSRFHEALENGASYEDVLDKAVNAIKNGIDEKPDIDVNSLTDYSQMKEKPLLLKILALNYSF